MLLEVPACGGESVGLLMVLKRRFGGMEKDERKEDERLGCVRDCDTFASFFPVSIL